jgi:V/A-type H+-transporting ATPase subunit A
VTILQRESELLEIARLVGKDSLSAADQVLLETAKIIREDFLQQNAFQKEDQYTSLGKQYEIIRTALALHEGSLEALKRGVSLEKVFSLPERQEMAQLKRSPEDQLEKIGSFRRRLTDALAALDKEGPGDG